MFDNLSIFIFSGLTSQTVILRGRDRTVRLTTEHCIVRTLLPQEESEGGKDECEIEEGRQETENQQEQTRREHLRQTDRDFNFQDILDLDASGNN